MTEFATSSTVPRRSVSSRSSSEAQSTPYQAGQQLFSDRIAESLPQHFGLSRKSISIPIQRKDFVPPHLMAIKEANDPMDTAPLSSSYCAGFRPVRVFLLGATANALLLLAGKGHSI